MRGWIHAAATICAIAACGSKKSGAPSSGSASEPNAPTAGSPGAPVAPGTGSAAAAPGVANAAQTKLIAKHGGADVAMTSAAAVRWGDDAVRILVANNPVPCAQALGGARVGTPRDDVSFYVTLTRAKADDGTSAWSLTSYTFDDVDDKGTLAPAQVTGELADGKTIDATFTYKGVSGTIEALVCGSHPADDAAAAGAGSAAPKPTQQ